MILYLFPASGNERRGIKIRVSCFWCSHVVSNAVSSSGEGVFPLLQLGVAPTADSPPLNSPVWVLLTDCSSSQTDPVWDPSCQEPVPVQASHRVTASFMASTCSGVRLLHRLQMDLCSPMALHRHQGYRYITMVFPTGCRRISAPAPGATPCLPSLTSMSAEWFVSYILTPLFSSAIISVPF